MNDIAPTALAPSPSITFGNEKKADDNPPISAENFAAHFKKAIELHNVRQFAPAAEIYRKLIDFQPNNVNLMSNYGSVMRALGCLHDGLPYAEKAYQSNPEIPAYCINYGCILYDLGRIDEASQCYERAFSISPHNPRTLTAYAHFLWNIGEVDYSIALARQAVALEPHHAESHLTLSLALLCAGNYSEGFREYEWRWLAAGRNHGFHHMIMWDGCQLNGKSVLITGEQGIGDTIQFARLIPYAAARGARIWLMIGDTTRHLFQRIPGIERHLSQLDEGNHADFRLPIMSLPLVLGLRPDAIPPPLPFIFVESDAYHHWMKRLGGGSELKIGIVWQGKPDELIDLGRSPPLSAYAPLGRLPRVRLISLQKKHGLDQLKTLPDGMKVEVFEDLDEGGGGAFRDTIALMKGLDLIITSDTSVVHIAGTLGVPVWLALKHSPEWRWIPGLKDGKSPWYPTLRIFRQPYFSQWEPIFRRMAAIIRAHLERNLHGEMKFDPYADDQGSDL